MRINFAVLSLLTGSVLWGLTWIPLKYFNQQGLAGVPLIFLVYGIIGILFLPFVIKQHAQWKKSSHYIWLIFLVGGTANLTFALAIVYGDVIRVMVLFYLLPAWGVLGGKIFLNEHIDKIRWIAVLLALSGAFIVLGGVRIFDAPPSWIDLLALSSGFALAMNNIVFRASKDLPVTSKIGMQFLGTFIFASLILIFQYQPFPSVSVKTLELIALFSVFGLMTATIATQWAITKMEVGRASILIIMELLTAVLSAIWLGDEQLSTLEIFGGFLIIIAAVLETVRSDNNGLNHE